MAEVTYIFGDVLTGEIIEEIRLTSVSFKHNLDGGEFRATFHLDQTGKDNDTLLAATTPGRCYVVVERDGEVIGDFLVWTRTYQSQAKVMQLYGVPYKEYTESRIMTANYTATNVEQRNIFLDIYTLMQSYSNSIKVDLPSTYPVVVPKTLKVLGSEYKTYRQVLDNIADATDGFDWVVRTQREGNFYRRWLEIGYPQLGSLSTDGDPVFEYIHTTDGSGGNITNYWCNDSMGSAATTFFGIGSGEGTAMLVSTFVHTNLLSSGFPRYDATFDRKDVSNQTILNGLTVQYATLQKAPTSVITAEVKGNTDPTFGAYGIGDSCRLVIQDARFPLFFSKTTRILGWEYYPPEDSNIEMVRLIFEGDPDA